MLKQAIRKRLGKAAEEEKGFTLIELLAVIVIIGIIAVIAIPMIGNILDKSKKDADVTTARQIYDAARMYIISEDNGTVPASLSLSLSDLQDKKYLDNPLYRPSDKKELVAADTSVDFDTNGQLVKVVIKAEGDTTSKEYDSDEIMKVEENESASK